MSMETTASRRPAARPARRGPGPEARIQAACVRVLERQLGAIVIRTNAGHWQTDDGHHIQGAKRGTSDLTTMLPNGLFCALEVKQPGQRPTPDQINYLQRVRAAGGVALWVDDPDAIRPALVERFGEALVQQWEAAACAAWDAALAERAVKRLPPHKRPARPRCEAELLEEGGDVEDLF